MVSGLYFTFELSSNTSIQIACPSNDPIYKVDHDKLAKHFGNREDDPDNTRFLAIAKIFPREIYKYIETGKETDGHLSLVVVLEDGYDKARLEETPMPSFDQRGATEILTAGVWLAF